jgi:hypothetical protein
MRIRSVLIACGASVLWLASAHGQQVRSRPGPLTELDYAEIKRVVGQYNHGYDTTAASDGAAMVGRSFTFDAFFDRVGAPSPLKGRAAIIASSVRPQLSIHHWVSNLLIDPAPEGAKSWSSLLLFTIDDTGRTVRNAGGGILHETYSKTSEGWQIAYRRYEALGTTPTINWPSPDAGRFVAALAPEGQRSRRDSGRRLSSRDYIEIEQLYIRNNIGSDSAANEGRAYAETFSPSGRLVLPSRTIAGRQNLVAFAGSNPPGLRTAMSNLLIEPSSNGATGSAYLLTADIDAAQPRPGSQSQLTGAGVYQDVLVKEPDGWRFSQRTYTPGMPPVLAGSSRRPF